MLSPGTHQFCGYWGSRSASASSPVPVSSAAVERRLGITQQLDGISSLGCGRA